MPEQSALLSGTRRSSSCQEHPADSPTFICRASTGDRGPGDVSVSSEGDFSFRPDEVTFSGFWRWRGHHDSSFWLPAEEVIGAVLKPGGFVVWYCPCRGPAHRQTRHLKRSPCFHTSESDAEKAVQKLRQAASWQGQSTPRRITVIINPVSGRGRATTIFIVGGDGTMNELLQGYLRRPDWKQAVKTPFVQVGAGSGNALSCNCGLWSNTTAAYALCKHKSRPLDIASIRQPSQERSYSFLSISYGIISNLDINTENLRWMGSIRFTIGALKEIIMGRSYTCQLAMLPADAKTAGSKLKDPDSLPSADKAGPRGPPTPCLDALGDLSTVNLMNDAALPKGWQSLGRKKACVLSAVNLAFIDAAANLAPQQELSNGELHLVLADKAGRLISLKFLALVDDKGSHLSMKEVHLNRICAFALQPEDPRSMIVVDGERMPFDRVFAEVHPALCQVLVA
ncbi:hypothetical protein WJX73_000264 [Symbiochloris irregularis]|uniref:DAGKc domain-containing protein n=1 Tax=Symbiochloris irregularis TaxID=706552 RepID=A0AAW1NLE2_9CHLO